MGEAAEILFLTFPASAVMGLRYRDQTNIDTEFFLFFSMTHGDSPRINPS